MDITLKLEEQNRNQITFGAGVSQYEGFFGQPRLPDRELHGPRRDVQRQPAGRVALAQNYQVAFTEPFLFDRPITGGVDALQAAARLPVASSRRTRVGGNIIFGFPVSDFTRMFLNYSYEHTQGRRRQRDLPGPAAARRTTRTWPTRCCSARAARARSARSSRASSTTRSTTRSSRRRARRYTVSVDLAGLGGDTNFYKPSVEAVWYLQQSKRTSIGLRAQGAVHRAVLRQQGSCRSSRSCSTRAANTACAASTSAPSGRGRSAPSRRPTTARRSCPVLMPGDVSARLVPGRFRARHRRQQDAAVQRGVPDLRSPARSASCSSTTRARCGTSGEKLNDEPSSRRRRARKSGSSCRC